MLPVLQKMLKHAYNYMVNLEMIRKHTLSLGEFKNVLVYAYKKFNLNLSLKGQISKIFLFKNI